MANPHRGSVSLQAGDRAYTLSFSINALCELEDAFDAPVAKIAADMDKAENVRIKSVRLLVWAGLRDHHEEVDLKGAGLIATEAGIPACMAAIGQAFKLAFPDREGKKTPRPPKAKDA